MESNNTNYLLSPTQLASLGSAALRRIVELLAGEDPLSRTEIADGLGRAPSTVHHQLRRLMREGLVVEAGQRASGKRPEKTYRLIAPRLSSAQASATEEGRAALAASGRRIATSAARAFERKVLERTTALAGPCRGAAVLRLALRLDDEGIGRLNELLDALVADLPQSAAAGSAVSLTVILN